jgi:uncharacterized protein
VYLTRVWSKEGVFGTEMAEVALEADALTATGVAIAVEEPGGELPATGAGQPVPAGPPVRAYRLDYYLETGPAGGEPYVTGRIIVRARGDGWRRSLDLQRSPSGAWTCETESEGSLAAPPPGGDLAALGGALDCDLELSPLTNTMPVRRHRLHERGGPVDIVTAWISVPDLTVRPDPQRYTFVRASGTTRVVRFESLDPDTDFTADIVFDETGMVLRYPSIAQQVA